MYYNYKHYFSIVLQGLADARYRSVAIDPGVYGKQPGGGVFHQSSIYQFRSNNFNMPNDKEQQLSDVEHSLVIFRGEDYPLLIYL
jgi:hypothetical protein